MPSLSAAYMRARRDGRNSTSALAIVRYAEKYSTFPWTGDSVLLPQGHGYVVRVRVVDDGDGDTSWLGTFSNDYAKGCVKHSDGRHGECRYFHPAMTEDEHYVGLRSLFYGKTEARQLAREYVRRDYKRMRTLGESWTFVGVVVEVHHDALPGVRLSGESIWGIESDSGLAYFEETAREMIPTAMRAARIEVARLKTVVSKL